MAENVKLRADKLVKVYDKNKTVVDEVSVEVNTGEIVGLLGPNGAGKTTTFKMMVGFTSPTRGGVFLNDQEITQMPLHKRARLGIGYLPQETSVFRKMTVRDNLKAILQAQGFDRPTIRKRINSLIDELGLGPVEHRLAEKLSGGEKRRTEIARALTTDPKFIFLDEPFAGIDPPTVEDIQRIIAQLKERGLGVLITDHQVRETLGITDRAYIMIEGKVIVNGTITDIVANSQIRSTYFTERIVKDLTSVEEERKALRDKEKVG